MGQFEKIVVLSVIGLIAVILVIALNDDDDPLASLPPDVGEVALADAGPLHGPLPQGPAPIAGIGSRSAPAPEDLDLQDPLGGRRGGARREQPQAPASAPSPAAPAAAEGGEDELLLSAGVGRGESESEPELVEGLPAGAALRTLRGLQDTWDADLKQYTCRRGDTFAGLARGFYGAADMEPLLRQFNEGISSPQAGDVLLVPVFDPRRQGAAPAAAAAPRGGGPGVHVVGEAENLWSIAKQHYGQGSLWNRIYEANRDRLPNPDSIRVGMQLVIP